MNVDLVIGVVATFRKQAVVVDGSRGWLRRNERGRGNACARHRQILRLGQKLRQQTVVVAVDRGFLRVRARGTCWRGVGGVGVVVARPRFLAPRNFKGVANQVAVKIKVAIAVAIVQSGGVDVDGVLAEVVVDELGAWHEIACVGVKTIPLAHPVERHVKVVRRRGRPRPRVLNDHRPTSASIQVVRVEVDGVVVVAVGRGVPRTRPRSSRSCTGIGTPARGVDVPAPKHHAVSIGRVDVHHHVGRVARARSREVEVEIGAGEVACQGLGLAGGLA